MNKKTINIIRFILGLFILFLIGCSNTFFSNPKVAIIFNIVCLILTQMVFPNLFMKDKSTDKSQPIERKIKLIFIIYFGSSNIKIHVYAR